MVEAAKRPMVKLNLKLQLPLDAFAPALLAVAVCLGLVGWTKCAVLALMASGVAFVGEKIVHFELRK